MDFLIQTACSFLPSPVAPYAVNFLRSFQNESSESQGPVLDFLKAQTPLLVSLIGIYFAATSMMRTLRVAYRSSLFFVKWGSLAALFGVIYQACTSSDPVQSLQHSFSTAVHSAGALGGIGGSALYWLSMFIGGETGDNVRKAAAWLFPDASKQQQQKRGAADYSGGPASGTRSRKANKKQEQAANPLAGLFNSAKGATNKNADDGSDAVKEFLAKVASGNTGDALKDFLGSTSLRDALGALSDAVGGEQKEGGKR